MNKYKKHIVGEMEDNMQFCIICGETITDYRGVCYPLEQGPPKGYASGDVWILEGFPKITTTFEPQEEFEICKP